MRPDFGCQESVTSGPTVRVTMFALGFLGFFLCACDNPATQEVVRGSERVELCSDRSALDLYEVRIAPLLSPSRPSSCTGCHLAGTQLNAFIRDSPCETMACLVEDGLVDLESPSESTFLTWILRGNEVAESSFITQETVQAEYDGFLAWIEHSATCGTLECGAHWGVCSGRRVFVDRDAGMDADSLDSGAGRDLSTSVLDVSDTGPAEICDGDMCVDVSGLDGYDCRPESIVLAYHENPNTYHSRCVHCHAEEGSLSAIGDPPPPHWLADEKTLEGAAITVENLFEGDYLDLEDPEESLILLKPLAEAKGGVHHGGGTKFARRTDRLYVALLRWINYVAICGSR
jgi:hypothetical protein